MSNNITPVSPVGGLASLRNSCNLPANWTIAPFVSGDVDNLFNEICLPIIFTIGLFGNILTVAILFRQKKAWHTVEKFLSALALSDTITLITDLLVIWLGHVRGRSLFDDSQIICIVHVFFNRASYEFSNWILATVTMERLLSVVIPHRVKIIFTPRVATILIVILAVTIFGSNVHVFFGVRLVGKDITYCWYASESFESFYENIWKWFELLIELAAPFTIILISNVILLYKLMKRYYNLRARNISNPMTAQRLTITVVLLCGVFCVSVAPYLCCRLLWSYWSENLVHAWCTDKEEYYRLLKLYTWIVAVTNAATYINPSMNFVLYVISGSRFQSELKALLLCRKAGNKNVFSDP